MKNRLVIKNYYLKSSKEIKNIKIVLISDIHMSSIFKISKFNKIINQIKNEKPNYICIPPEFGS